MSFINMGEMEASRFNSIVSQSFLEAYENYRDASIISESKEKPSQNFAPSSMRCPRLSWFRLRGTEPDSPKSADKVLDFTAKIGTACHEYIQKDLSDMLKENWISVEDYLDVHSIPHKYTLEAHGMETRIAFEDIPIRFACDGIIFWEGKYYLLEIKTSEYGSFRDLQNPKEEHIEQIKTYLTLLDLEGALVLYQERQHGETKCYELKISKSEKEAVMRSMLHILELVKYNIAPDRLPSGDPWCSPSRCRYYKKCREWG